jgi:hypothetical protein
MFNGQITYGDIFSIVLVLGISGVVLLGGIALIVMILGRRK